MLDDLPDSSLARNTLISKAICGGNSLFLDETKAFLPKTTPVTGFNTFTFDDSPEKGLSFARGTSRRLLFNELPDTVYPSQTEYAYKSLVEQELRGLHQISGLSFADLPDTRRRTFVPPGRSLAQTPAETWQSIVEFEKDPFYQVGAFYGRSVATTKGTGSCSAWLFGGPYLMTAAHCREPRVPWEHPSIPPYPSYEIDARFGIYGKGLSPQEQKLLNYQEVLCLANKAYSGGNPYECMSKYSHYARGIQDAYDRLIDLGIPEEYIQKVPLRWVDEEINNPGSYSHTKEYLGMVPEYHKFRCRFQGTWSARQAFIPSSPLHRDIDYFECPPYNLRYKLPWSSLYEEVPLLPSHIFGHIPVEWGPQEQKYNYLDRSVYFLSVNNPVSYDRHHVVLSPNGRITQLLKYSSGLKISDDPYWKGRPIKEVYPNDFEVTGVNLKPGSSGGACMDFLTNRAIGLYSEGPDSRADSINQIAFIPQNISNLQWPLSIIYPFTVRPTKFTDWLYPQNNSTYIQQECPPGFAAAGVIGSAAKNYTSKEEWLGNLGLVCMPFEFPSIQNNIIYHQYQFEHAKVIAGGSEDTGSPTPLQGIPFDEYINENLATGDMLPRMYVIDLIIRGTFGGLRHKYIAFARPGFQQHFAMCPPGHYLQNMLLSSSPTQIDNILLLWCARGGSRGVVPRQPRGNSIGASASFRSDDSTLLNFGCKQGYVIDGMNVQNNKNNYIRNIQFRCRDIS